MSTFVDTFDDSEVTEVDSPVHFGNSNSHSHGGDGGDYVGYNSEQFDSFPAPIYGEGGEFGTAEENGSSGFDGDFGGSSGPVLPAPSEMAEVGLALREWTRENALRLEEKEKKERELLSKIIEEAEDFKVEFHKKREVTCQSNKAINREREKVRYYYVLPLILWPLQLFVTKEEKFHVEADKEYWKSIADLIPNEVPALEKKKTKKDQEQKPSIMVVQGPKPGKPTELSRLRHILLQLKHNTPPHLKLAPPPPAKDPKASDSAAASTSTAAAAEAPKAPEPVAVA
ncbi:unnamed protein product [Linum tenue]|uniref:Clathrin light chain n=1 Tax=Linum tenue TaxID=586396 RepID=A0AAV0K1D7_9ROSI|nr:unnamed protein product [Linum tenue]